MKLHDAAKAGNTAEVIRLLTTSGILRRKADVNEKDDGMTALMWAACEGHAETVQELINAGADMEIKQYGGSTALILAAGKGHIEAVQVLIKAGAIINAQQRENWTALMSAANQGHTKVVQALLKAGAKADVKNKSGVTALDLATENKHSEVISLLQAAAKKPALVVAASGSAHGGAGYSTSGASLPGKISAPAEDKSRTLWNAARDGDIAGINRLLSAGSDVNLLNRNSNTPLMCAIAAGQIESVKVLLAAGANTESQDDYGRTALILAALRGKTKIVQALLISGANIEVLDNNGETALMWAAWSGHKETVEVLLAAGAKADIKNKKGKTALDLAIEKNHSEVISLLQSSAKKSASAATVSQASSVTASVASTTSKVHGGAGKSTALGDSFSSSQQKLWYAVRDGNISTIKDLIATSNNIDEKNEDGKTALMYAASDGKTDIVHALLAAGAKIESQDNDGSTALMLAAFWGKTKAVQVLLAGGAKIESRDDEGQTALMLAASQGKIATAQALLAAGANIESHDKEGRTALIGAAWLSNKETVQALLVAGANIESQDKEGQTALMYAAEDGKTLSVQALLSAGAKVDAKNKIGKTALDLAIEKNQLEVISVLQAAAKKSAPSSNLAHGSAGISSDGASSSSRAVAPTPASYAVIPYSKLQFTGKVLGEGGFGIVKEAKWNFMDVAVKQFKAAKLADDALLELENEAKRHAALRFPTIVQLYGVCLEAFKYCMVMELMVGGSLYEVLHNGKELPWPVRLSIAKDIAAGLSYLHENGILHRDLKSLNVLLDDRMRAKLSDFGLSKVKTESTISTSSSKQAVGTLNWMAPELFKMGGKYNELTDIYALGQVLWEIASRKVPFHEANGKDALIKDWIKEGNRNEVPEETPPKYASLIQQCWAQDPKIRPQAASEVAESLSQYQVATVMPAHGGAGRSERPADSIGNKLFS